MAREEHKWHDNWKKNMSDDMIAAQDTMAEDVLKAEVLYCQARIIKCKELVKGCFPGPARNGEKVVAGASHKVQDVIKYWEKRRDLAKQYLPESWLEENSIELKMNVL